MANLWGKEIVVNEQESLLEDFSLYLETSMLATIEIFKSIIIIQKMGWLNDARDFLPNTLPKICAEVENFLVSNKLMNPPNWKMFLKDRLEIATEAGQLIHSYHEDCFKMCASQYQQQYQATYEQELAKQDGLGFGILSSSLAAHLVYAAQSARKEIENEKKASEAADKIMSATSPVDRAAQMTIAFYHKKFDPFVVDFLVGFYSDIEKLIYDGLDVDKERLENNKTLSENELSNISADNHREIIATCLSKYPFNGNALLWAVRYDDAGDELIEFCSESPRLIKKYLYAIEESATAFLKKQREKADLYNRDPLTDDVIQILQNLRTFLKDERISGFSTYDSIIQEVYGDKIDFVCKDFETLERIKSSTSALSSYAKTRKTFSISQNSFETLQRYNTIFGISKIGDVLNFIPNEADSFNEMMAELSAEIKREYEKHQEAERKRKQKELEKAEQERKAEEQQKAEEQRQKDLAKAKYKKIFSIVASLVAAVIIMVVLLNSVIIPNSKYNNAKALMDSAQYDDAIVAFEALNGYRDSDFQILNSKYLKAISVFDSKMYEKALSLFGDLQDFEDSNSYIIKCHQELAEIAFESKKYDVAVEHFTQTNNTTKANEAKYLYIKSHYNNTDKTTYDYLQILKAINYQDTDNLYKQLYDFSVEVVINSSPNDTSKNEYQYKYLRGQDLGGYIYIHIKVTGGTPGSKINCDIDGWQWDSGYIPCDGQWHTFVDGRLLIYGQSRSSHKITVAVNDGGIFHASSYHTPDTSQYEFYKEYTVTVYE